MVTPDEADDLLYCARTGELDDVKIWMESKVQQGNVNGFIQLMREIGEANEAGNTLLHFGAANGHMNIINYIIPQIDLPLLLAQNSSGNTPLHWASLNGHMEAVEALISRIEELTPKPQAKDLSHLTEEQRDAEEEKEARKRSVWDVVNHAGKGPMSEAQMNNQDKIVSFLLQHMIAGLGSDSS